MKSSHSKPTSEPSAQSDKPSAPQASISPKSQKNVEFGGPKGPEPTRYGDWEKAGRCSDF